ncbi:hypothetical protein DNTS_027856 [Danionella cerebrum]|uniref:PPM-type phosphatase domain-containing protein n=1 Tax=Danionella cerebrum TaxID=2873325 RepID=A0A553R9I1_9TELE|nr:hypothetical protein DNTS_027856 [Danionella translucida]
MMNRVRTAVSSLLNGIPVSPSLSAREPGPDLPLRFPYSRPDFLALSPDEVQCSADHGSRPILILKEPKLPWRTGYAEVINAGKSVLNEDQACCELLKLHKSPSDPNPHATGRRRSSLPSTDTLQQDRDDTLTTEDPQPLLLQFWGVFDGHGGSGSSLFCSQFLHQLLQQHLEDVLDVLRDPEMTPPTCLGQESPLNHPSHSSHHCRETQRGLSRAASLRATETQSGAPRFFMEKKIQQESLVVGALENTFTEMDAQIARERSIYSISGGCTALVVICLLGKLYVANAGDSRAVIVRSGEVLPMSNSFTPDSERQRLQLLAHLQPSLLGNEFTHLEFPRRARVLATIGITRGLGDHDLKVHDSDVCIKPFMSCSPEVKVYNLSQFDHGADDVMILATDGLWDVLTNQEAAETVYTLAAQDLVMKARGVLNDRGWRIAGDRPGSLDDISVFIIPLMYGSKQPQPS